MYVAVQWGDVPTWASAVTTFGALVFAAVAAVVAGRLYGIELRRDREAEEDRRDRARAARRYQASQIAAWCGNDGINEYGNRITGPAGVLLHNASQLPVFDLTIYYFWRIGTDHFRPLVTTPASGLWPNGHVGFPIPLLPPRSQPLFLEMPAEVYSGLGESLHDQVVPGLIFRDSDGARWQRRPDGSLEELV